MSTKQEREQDARLEKERSDGRDDRIRQRVISALGKPAGLQVVHVRPLWGDHFRVNVFCGADALSAKIAQSYFVEADAAGNIIHSTPKIAGQN